MVRFFPFQMNYVKSELLIPIPLIFLRSDHIFFLRFLILQMAITLNIMNILYLNFCSAYFSEQDGIFYLFFKCIFNLF